MITGAIPIGRMPIDYLAEGTKGMNDIFNRVRAAALEQQKINDAVNYHKSSIGLQGAAGGRAERGLQAQLEAARDAHQMARLKYDPQAQAEYFQNLMQSLSGSGEMPTNPMASNGINTNEYGMTPPAPGGDVGDFQRPGASMYEPAFGQASQPQQSGMPEMQSPSQAAPQNPLKALSQRIPREAWGALKNATGIDLAAAAGEGRKETPHERQQRELDTYQKKLAEKEEFDKAKEKRRIENDLPLTNAMKTQLQNIVSGVPKVTKKIDDLKAAPSPTTLIGYKPNDRAKHAALVLEAAESYTKAKGWPNTNESIKAAREILDRHLLESDKSYRKRLDDLKDSLHRDFKDARETLHPVPVSHNTDSQKSSSIDFSNMSDDELHRIASGG